MIPAAATAQLDSHATGRCSRSRKQRIVKRYCTGRACVGCRVGFGWLKMKTDWRPRHGWKHAGFRGAVRRHKVDCEHYRGAASPAQACAATAQAVTGGFEGVHWRLLCVNAGGGSIHRGGPKVRGHGGARFEEEGASPTTEATGAAQRDQLLGDARTAPGTVRHRGWRRRRRRAPSAGRWTGRGRSRARESTRVTPPVRGQLRGAQTGGYSLRSPPPRPACSYGRSIDGLAGGPIPV